jgi:hypothetical protein
MQTLIPTQSAAMFHIDHVCRSGGIGARSSFVRLVSFPLLLMLLIVIVLEPFPFVRS